jgi:hypothetical protein
MGKCLHKLCYIPWTNFSFQLFWDRISLYRPGCPGTLNLSASAAKCLDYRSEPPCPVLPLMQFYTMIKYVQIQKPISILENRNYHMKH